ncbi:S1C family serine protease [Haloechinothrix salitolerans]|uniref:S1C family serine protease n=1 Tax=Haloechinothrix salitolerans TaxID=926830 RepID=A0ABW2C2D9_9PSEU
MVRSTRVIPTALITFLLALATACTPAQEGTRPPQDTNRAGPTAAPGELVTDQGYAALVDQVAPSVVTVRAGQGIGSGVVFKSDVVITNAHVVKNSETVTLVFADGTEANGDVVATDSITDLAVVRSERGQLPVPDYREQLPRTGDRAIAIGSPLGFENSVTAGIISGLNREIPGSASRTQALVDLIQTDAPISPGNSGGALIDTRGRIIGINEAYIPPKAGAVSLGFAIPAATVIDTAEELLNEGTATHPYLGVSLARLTPQLAEKFNVGTDSGAVVLGVADDGPAASAGIRPGDVIVGFAGAEVTSVEDLLGALRDTEPGQEVSLLVARNSEERELTVTIGERRG